MAAPVAIGEVVAEKYRVERVLGQGGMGVVVAAVHVQLDQRVALKFLLPEGLANEEVVGRFLREAKSAVRLRSEHVARVLDVGQTEDGAPYIVMEFLDGRDLSEVLADTGTLSVPVAVGYVLQACEAVAEAHAAGVVHRDLKPANLFLIRRNDGSACIKVLDFGISKATGPNADNLTKTSGMLGTPSYMSPEQMRSSKSVDTRSDIWALGMILYELVTGQVAFVQQTLPELCAAVLTDATPPPRDLVPDLPEALEEAILRALAKDPRQRFQTLAAFSAAIALFAPGGEAARDRVSRILGLPAVATSDATLPDTPRPGPTDERTLSSLPGADADPDAVASVAPSDGATAPPTTKILAPDDEAEPGQHALSVPDEAEQPKSSRTPKIVAVLALLAVLGGSAVVLQGRARPNPGASAPQTSAATSALPAGSMSAPALFPSASTSPLPAAVLTTASAAPVVVAATASGKAHPVKGGAKLAPPVGTGTDFGGRK